MFYTHVLKPILYSIANFGDRNAFCIKETFYTYREFGKYVSKIRTAIAGAKHRNRNVGLVLNDDIETYASIIALWLQGESYVPLHSEWPLSRCMDIAEQVGLDLILDSSDVTRYDGHLILTHSVPFTGDNLCYHNNASDEDLAYILFTSGSTGKPKGVQLMRKNVGAFMDSFWETGINIDENDRCLQCFDLTFDVSVQSYLVALTRGACLYTIPYGKIKYICASRLIEDHRLTFGAMAPSMLRYLKPYFDEIDMRSLKCCILTAEASPLSLLEEWHEVAPNAEIYNFYGPTEATIYCTYYRLKMGGVEKRQNIEWNSFHRQAYGECMCHYSG